MSDDISNRHMLPADGIDSSRGASLQSVRIVVDEDWAESVAGQLLACCLVNLLCRQVGIVKSIEILSPQKSLLVLSPTGAANFPAALVELARWATGDKIPVLLNAGNEIPDIVVNLGSQPSHDVSATHTLMAFGGGWRAWVGDVRHAPTFPVPTSRNPLGPFLAASLVCGEIFKRSRGITRGRYLEGRGYSLWSGKSSETLEKLDDGPEIEGHTLPPLHVVGTGAVGNGLAYVLINARLSNAYASLIDDDSYDTTNLNRCMLAGIQDVGAKKVSAVAAALQSFGVGAFPFEKSVRDYIVDTKPGLGSDLAAEFSSLKFGTVISCVDKNTSRHDVQSLCPEHLFGASTLGMTARSNVYGLRPDAACLACHNPPEKDGDRLRKMEVRLRVMSSAERSMFCNENGLNVKDVEEYLASEKCGALGETALRDFVMKPPPEFSAGFVSLGSALLLSSFVFRHLLFAGTASERKDMVVLNYLNSAFEDAGFAADDNCEMCRQWKMKLKRHSG